MSALAGTGGLIRLILRRDRIVLPVWILVLALLPTLYASANAELFSTPAERIAYANGILSSPAQLALLGPLFDSTIGALTAWRSGLIYVFVALASLLTVVRHTRTEEEAGRREMLGATVVGRRAPLAAALLVTVSADAVLGLLAAGGLASTGLPAGGSFAFGFGLASAGWVFATVGGIAAQVTQGARAARGVAIAALGAAFLLRAAGDAGGQDGALAWLSWLSPIGWAQQIRPYADERWWVFALVVAAVAVLAVTGFALTARRDVGAGLLPTRPGPAHASSTLRSSLALAWRLHRGVLLAWSAGFVVVGVVVGSVAATVASSFGENQVLLDVLERLGGKSGLIDAYFSASMGVFGLAASGYAVSAALRLRSEEQSMRAEPILATSVSRVRWMTSHLGFSLLGPAVILAMAGLGAGVVHGANTGDMGREVPRLLGTALAQLPAVWILSGLAVALFGLIPRLAVATWAVLASWVFLGQFGSLMRLDQWLLDLSAFTHLPKLPGGEVTPAPLVWLVGIAAVLIAIGLAGFRRRDVG
jgi:polyether ionophore transport system permease protein